MIIFCLFRHEQRGLLKARFTVVNLLPTANECNHCGPVLMPLHGAQEHFGFGIVAIELLFVLCTIPRALILRLPGFIRTRCTAGATHDVAAR